MESGMSNSLRLTSENLSARVRVLKAARREVNSEAMDKYLLKNGLNEFEDQPKYISVTKRLYRPYDRLFSSQDFESKPKQETTLVPSKITLS